MGQVIHMIQEKQVIAADGSRVPLQADTVCIHGDGAHALSFAGKIKEALQLADIRVCAAGEK